jgi:hypothetical protein
MTNSLHAVIVTAALQAIEELSRLEIAREALVLAGIYLAWGALPFISCPAVWHRRRACLVQINKFRN